MSGQITTIRSVALVVLLLLWGVGIGVPAHADNCLTGPGSSSPKGSHWYYRTDRTKGQKCWYLRPLSESAQQPARQDKLAAPAHTGAVEKPATKLTPISTEADDGTPAVPPPKAQPATISDTTTRQPVGQPVQGEDAVSSSPETSTSGGPWQNITPAPAPGADPPAVTAPPANLAPNNGRPVSAPPVVDAQVSDNSKNAVQSVAPITPSVGTLAETFLVVAIGLMLVAFLYRIIMKIVVTRGERINIRRSELEWIGDRIWCALRRGQQQHQSVDARNELTGKRMRAKTNMLS